MKRMRRMICWMTALALLMTARTALAARGDAIIARYGLDGFDDSVRGVCAVGDEIWLQGGGNENVYVYDTTTGEMTACPWDEATYAAMNGENRDETGARLYERIGAWFACGGEVRVLLSKYRVGGRDGLGSMDGIDDMSFGRVYVRDGRAVLEETGPVDWARIADDVGGDLNLRSTAVVNGALCGIAQSMGGQSVCILPLDGSAARAVYLGDAWADDMTSWNDELLLVQNGDGAQYALMSTESGEIGAWQPLPGEDGAQADNASGAVQYGNELLYLSGGTLMALELDTGASRAITNIPIDTWGAPACVTESGVYAAGSYNGVALRALERGGAAETLTINDADYTGAAEEAIVSFQNAQSDAEIQSVQRGDVLTALLTRSTEDDVIILESGSGMGELYAILSRGWARPIESEALAEYVSGMYPAVSGALMKDGKALGVPFDAMPEGPGLCAGALKALGLTIDDVPTSWPELIDWLNGLIPTAEIPLWEDGGSAEQIRRELVDRILDAYRLELGAGTVSGYDTDELRAALAAVERLDAEGLCEQFERVGEAFEFYPLFTSIAMDGISGATYQEEYDTIPLYLSLSDALPRRIALRSSVAIINPYSAHIDLATRFLETLAEQDTQRSRAMLRPDANETVRSADYERHTAEYDAKIARLEAELETAADDVKDVIEQDLDNARTLRARMENWYWVVSRESLEHYRANDAGVTFDMRRRYSSYDEIRQYCAGQMSMDEFIAALQRTLEMMRLEEQ